jgi:transcriptional regulator with XRE-family HTH domain
VSIDLIQRQLRAARLVAGRTQQSVADAIGVTKQAISEWENGGCGITLASLRTWARALDHTVVLLPMSGPGSTSPEPGPVPHNFGEMGRLHWCEFVEPDGATHGVCHLPGLHGGRPPAESTKDGTETIGQLHDRLPVGEPVALPEFGVTVTRWPDGSSTENGEPRG